MQDQKIQDDAIKDKIDQLTKRLKAPREQEVMIAERPKILDYANQYTHKNMIAKGFFNLFPDGKGDPLQYIPGHE
jgi:hypothetical protein